VAGYDKLAERYAGWIHTIGIAAAQIVLAHWAASLVQQAEHCGCWFLEGSSKKILQQIFECLSAENHAVQSLVSSLIDEESK
jgi:hypothetical protein